MSTKKPAVAVAAKPTTPVVVAPIVAPIAPTTITLTRSTKPRKGSSLVFEIPGTKSTVKIARSAFAVVPETITVVGSPFVAAKAKLTKEERAALRAKLTPSDKARIARERATRAAARAAKLEAAAAV